MTEWGGRHATRVRGEWAARLPLPCFRCQGIVTAADRWDVEHDPPRVTGRGRVVGVSHASCNRAEGARLGNARRSLGGVDTSW